MSKPGKPEAGGGVPDPSRHDRDHDRIRHGGTRRDRTHPDITADAPGRIPESLIDAAIDGDLDPMIQREIAHALKYDPKRSAELRETADAINALQMPVAAPDLTHAILTRADRHRRFLPRSWRKHVRAGRLGLAACLLLTLMGVAGLQRMYPRFTTIASHPTPVRDVELAVAQDRQQCLEAVTNEVESIKASVEPVTGLFRRPGRSDFNYDVSISSTALASGHAPRQSHTIRFSHTQPGLTAIYMLSETGDLISPAHRPLGLISASGGPGLAYAGWTDTRLLAVAPRSAEPARPTEIDGLDVPDLP